MTDVYVLGDIHGNLNYLDYIIESNRLSNCIIIQVGDFGVGFVSDNTQEKILLELNDKLESNNITMLAIRGNHDDKKYFLGNNIYSNLKLLKDYTTMDINGEKFLFVGGAISIDRKYRKAMENNYGEISYWIDEVFVLDRDILSEMDLDSIDVLITHSTTMEIRKEMENYKLLKPYMVEQFVSMYNDFSLKYDLDEESNDIQLLRDMLPNIKYHYFGHFHESFETTIDNCRYTLLDINEIKKH